ncbi:MAG: dihydrodipicolinate synthase family protein [Candidatus Micrarchaeia archaeon]
MKTKDFSGVITPMITPFKQGRIDSNAIGRLVDFLLKSKVSGLFPAGSTGCFPFLTAEQHVSLLREVAEYISGKTLFLPGVGRNSFTETVYVAKNAEKLGADAIVVVTPYYIKLDDRSLLNYFDKVADSTKSSIILYNIPQFTGTRISAEVAATLAKRHGNVIGIKDSSGGFRSISEMLRLAPEGFLVFQGQDDLLLPSLRIGASGGVCGTTNFSSLAVKVYKEYKAGRLEKAMALQSRLTQLMHVLKGATFPLAYNYLFNRIVASRNATGAIEPFDELSLEEKERLYSSARKLV